MYTIILRNIQGYTGKQMGTIKLSEMNFYAIIRLLLRQCVLLEKSYYLFSTRHTYIIKEN